MKHKIILLQAVILSITCTNLFAQTEKGNFILGGNVSFAATKNNTEILGEKAKVTHIILQPYGGYFLFDQFTTGLSVDLDYNSTIKKANVSVLSDFRYYFGKSGVKPFVKVNAGYSNQVIDVGTSSYIFRSNAHGLKVGGGAGIALFIKDNISIDVTGQYFYSSLKRVGGGTNGGHSDMSRDFKVKVDELRLFIGFSVYF